MKKELGRWIQRQARARDVSVRRYSTSNDFEPYLRNLLRALGIEVVIDVGANQGQTVEELRELGFTGSIVSFEPTPHLHDALVQRFSGDPRWTGHQLALGAEAGSLTLNRFGPEESLNSFLTPTAFGAERFKNLREPVGTVDVPVTTLDAIWDELIPSGRTFLKVDTQGFDVEVLKGGSASLEHVLALVTEVPINPIYEGMPTMREVFALLDDLGFQLSGLYPVTRDKRGVRMIEANCVFVRGDALDA